MSVMKNYYVIVGYDLTGYETDKYDDWKWSEKGEKYTCNHIKGEIQLFDDPMSGLHLYFGYILVSGDEYDFETTSFELSDIEKHTGNVKDELIKLQEIGVISRDPHFKPVLKIIVFEECT